MVDKSVEQQVHDSQEVIKSQDSFPNMSYIRKNKFELSDYHLRSIKSSGKRQTLKLNTHHEHSFYKNSVPMSSKNSKCSLSRHGNDQVYKTVLTKKQEFLKDYLVVGQN